MRLALFLLLLVALPAGAQMHKCVDERGATRYSDKPQPGCRGGEVDIQPIPPVWGKITPYKEDLKAAESDFKRRQVQREKAEAAEAKRVADQQKRCASLRVERDRYASVRRMDDKLREAKLASLDQEISKKCG